MRLGKPRPPAEPDVITHRRAIAREMGSAWGMAESLLSGRRLHRRALPFFLGFILGEFTMGGVFGFIGVLFPDTAGYQTYP